MLPGSALNGNLFVLQVYLSTNCSTCFWAVPGLSCANHQCCFNNMVEVFVLPPKGHKHCLRFQRHQISLKRKPKVFFKGKRSSSFKASASKPKIVVSSFIISCCMILKGENPIRLFLITIFTSWQGEKPSARLTLLTEEFLSIECLHNSGSQPQMISYK